MIKTREENDLILAGIFKECRQLDINELEKRNERAKEQLAIETALMFRVSPREITDSQAQIKLLDGIINIAKGLNCR